MNDTSQQEDDLVRKAITTVGEEKPSADFTSNFMARLREHVASPQFIYRPVFSKRTWYIIAALTVVIMLSFLIIPSGSVDPSNATPFGKLQPAVNGFATAISFLREQFSTWGIWMIGLLLVPLLYFTDRFLRKQFKKSSVESN